MKYCSKRDPRWSASNNGSHLLEIVYPHDKVEKMQDVYKVLLQNFLVSITLKFSLFALKMNESRCSRNFATISIRHATTRNKAFYHLVHLQSLSENATITKINKLSLNLTFCIFLTRDIYLMCNGVLYANIYIYWWWSFFFDRTLSGFYSHTSDVVKQTPFWRVFR